MPIILQQISGLSDSKWSGVAGSVSKCVGLDIHSTPGLTKVNQKLTKESGTTIDSLVKVAVTVSTGESFWFASDSGKIWRRSNASPGVWLLVYTTSPAAGSAGCLGAAEYNGFLYWATQSRLHRISMSTAIATAANWTSFAVPDWATFAKTDALYHPMALQNLTLFIGDANQVASVNSVGTFNNNALDIKTPNRISDMIEYELDILLGTFQFATVNEAVIIRWDTESPSWNTSDPVYEVGVNCFIRDDNYMYVQCGLKGNIYFYNGEQLVLFKKIPGDWSGSNKALIHPGAASYFNGRPVFGLSNSSGNPADQGVYQLGSYGKDYPKVLSLDWVISPDKVATVELGVVMAVGDDLLVSWKDGSNYGVDILDTTLKYASAYFETMMLFQDQRDMLKTLKRVSAMYNSLPASTSITFSYSINGAAYVAMTSVTDAILNEVYAELSVENVGSLQIKAAFGVSSNDAPTVEGLSLIIE